MNLKCKSYKEMNPGELIAEIQRVKTLLSINKNFQTQNQHRKYLSRLEERYYELLHNNKK